MKMQDEKTKHLSVFRSQFATSKFVLVFTGGGRKLEFINLEQIGEEVSPHLSHLTPAWRLTFA